MKAWILSVMIFAGIINQAAAQEEQPRVSRIKKGESFLNMKLQTSQKNRINDSFYLTKSLGIGGGYYFLNRFAVKATIMGQRYDAIEAVAPTAQEFDDKNLILLSGQLRYNFWELPGWGSTFLQSGYSYGKFTSKEYMGINRWEIISVGHTVYISEKKLKNFGMEVGGGIEKENLNRKLHISVFVGLNYYFGEN